MESRKFELNCLSGSEIISRLENLVKSEKEITAEVIRHLAEVDRRGLYAELGFSSLFDYVTKNLGYSKSAAMRRINVARAGKKLPEIFSYLEDESVTLSSLDACSGVLQRENGKSVLEELKGKSRAEAEWLSASYQPVRCPKDKVARIFVGEAPTLQQPLFYSHENSNEFRCGTKYENNQKFKFTFSADEEFMEKLKRVQELMFTGKSEDLKLEKVLGEALDLVIEKYCPKERQERREARLAKKEKQTVPQIKKPTNQRYIPIALRDEVLKRDNYHCSYEGPYGRCSCPVGLEIDHIVPFAKGGRTEIKNLRVLCSTHHMLATVSEFGRKFINQKIGQTRERTG